MKDTLSKISSLKVQEPQILEERDPSVTAVARRLADYASREKADMIVAATHARKGLKRFFLGSFVESLLYTADIPILLVNPDTRVRGQVKRILFPTDFSPASRKVFDRLCRFASAVKAEVLLYHVIRRPELWLERNHYLKIGNRLLSTSEYLTDLKKSFRREAETWVRGAGRGAPRIAIEIEDTFHEIEEEILKKAKTFDLIGIASQSGKIKAAFLGSTARAVLRNARKPVWVMHPA